MCPTTSPLLSCCCYQWSCRRVYRNITVKQSRSQQADRSTVLNHRFLTALKESKNVLLIFTISSAVSLLPTRALSLPFHLYLINQNCECNEEPRRDVLSFLSGLYSSKTGSNTEWSGSCNREQCGCNSPFDHHVGNDGRVALSVFSLIDSTCRRRCKSTLFIKYIFLQSSYGQWVNETKNFVCLCCWQFLRPMCNSTLIGHSINEKNGCRQTEFSSI